MMKRKAIKIEKAMIKKSTIDWMNAPYMMAESPFPTCKSEKSTPPNKIPTSGIIMLSTSEVTIAPNAPPMTTPTAKSKIFPFRANSLKSFHILKTPFPSK